MPIVARMSDARSLPAAAQEDLRRKAVRAVLEEGMTQKKVASLFGVSRQAVNGWVGEYRASGVVALRAKKRGRPPEPSRLTGPQAAAVVRAITSKCPDQLMLPFALWTRDAVRELIFVKCGIRVSPATVGRYLKRWGMTPQRPVRRAYERNDAGVKAWLREEYPAIAARAKRENAEIHWGDQAGFRSDDQRGRSYSKRGVTPIVPGTGKRFKCNMMSAVTNRGHLSFMVFTSNFNGKVFTDFMRRLMKQSGADKARRGEATAKVFLIVDGHSAHRGGAAAAWLAANKAAIEVFYLPGYSPELNPDELINHDAKAAVGAKRPKSQPEMIDAVRAHMRRRQRQPAVVKRLFEKEQVRYAAA